MSPRPFTSSASPNLPAALVPTATWRPLPRAIFIALLCVAGTVAQGLHAPAALAQTTATRAFDIPAGSLSETLGRFANAAGVALSFDAAQTRNLQSEGVQGVWSVDAGFARVLVNTGLQAVREPNGAYSLRTAAPISGAVGPAGAATLPLVTVSGAAINESPNTENTGSYASRLVTIGKGVQAIKDIPQSVTVVTRQKMEDQNLNTIDAVLANTTGITMYDSPMGGRYVFSRGFRVDTYQFDGVNRAFFYPQANSFVSNTALIERVEVVRGATGLLQGSGAPSAAVNLVRKRPMRDKQFTVMGSAGSWNNYRTEVDATGPLNDEGTLRGRAVASYNDRDYFYDTAKSRTGVGYGVLEYDLSPATTLTAGISQESLRSTPFFQGLPTYSNGADLGLRRSTFLGADWNRWNSDQTSAFAEIKHQIDADWSVKATAVYTREAQDVKYMFPLGTVNPRTLAGSVAYGGVFDMETKNRSLDVSVDGKFNAFGRRHGISVGANVGELTSTNDFSLAMLNTPVNVFAPVSPAEPTNASLLANRYRGGLSRNRIEQSGGYGVARFSLADPLTLIMGSRVSWYESTQKNLATGLPSATPAKEDAIVTPYGGLVYAINPQWSAYVSYTDIFQPQTSVTYTGALLPPIKGKNYEAGIKGELLDGRVNTALSVFRINQKNRAEQDLVNICQTSSTCSRAAGELRSQGIDAEISGEIARGWQVFAGYTLNNFKYMADTSNAGLDFASTYSPKHMLRLWTDYRLPGELHKWSVGGGVNFQTESSRTTSNLRLAQSSYAVWSARVGYEIDRNWSVSVLVNNVFDKTYYQTIGANSWGNFYGEPRSVTATLRGKF